MGRIFTGVELPLKLEEHERPPIPPFPCCRYRRYSERRCPSICLRVCDVINYSFSKVVDCSRRARSEQRAWRVLCVTNGWRRSVSCGSIAGVWAVGSGRRVETTVVPGCRHVCDVIGSSRAKLQVVFFTSSATSPPCAFITTFLHSTLYYVRSCVTMDDYLQRQFYVPYV